MEDLINSDFPSLLLNANLLFQSESHWELWIQCRILEAKKHKRLLNSSSPSRFLCILFSLVLCSSIHDFIPITDCRECLAKVATHHWMRPPQSYHISCYLMTFSYLLNSFWQILDHWLVEPHNSSSFVSHNENAWHSFRCPITGSSVLITMNSLNNVCNLTSFLEPKI